MPSRLWRRRTSGESGDLAEPRRGSTSVTSSANPSRRPRRSALTAGIVVGVLAAATVAVTVSEVVRGPSKLSLRWVEVPANAPPVGPFRVAGNMIFNGRGQPFFVHGVNRPSLEWACQGQSLSGAPGIPASDFTTMVRTWGTNTVRLPLNQDFWLSALGYKVSPQARCPNYIATVSRAVGEAKRAGMAVILDLHWSDRGNTRNPPAQQPMADTNSTIFWKSVAKRFGSNPSVMFELYNEPHSISWSTWRNGGTVGTGSARYHAVGMQQLLDTVRSAGAPNVVLAGGIHWASDLSGVFAHPLAGSNVAYAVHPYQSKYRTSAKVWQAKFGSVAAHAPVVATEFGSTQSGVNHYDTAILSYFASHGIGYTAWAWWAGGPSFPSLLSSPTGSCINGGCPTQANLLEMTGGRAVMRVQVPSGALPNRAVAGWKASGGGPVTLRSVGSSSSGQPSIVAHLVPARMAQLSFAVRGRTPIRGFKASLRPAGEPVSVFPFRASSDGSISVGTPVAVGPRTRSVRLPGGSGPLGSVGVFVAGTSSSGSTLQLSTTNH